MKTTNQVPTMTNRNSYTHLSQSDIALQIESLVQAIENTDTPAFRT